MSSGGVLFLAGLLSVFGPARKSAHEGEKQFRAGDLEAAERSFGEAARRDPQDPLWKFDLGTVKARGGKGAEARRELESAARGRDAGVAAAASYQLGTLDLQDGKYPGAIRNLRRALELDPGRGDAKRNLEIALRRASPPPPSPKTAAGKPAASGEKEFEKKAGMSRAQAEALLRSLDDEQKRRERASESATGKDW